MSLAVDKISLSVPRTYPESPKSCVVSDFSTGDLFAGFFSPLQTFIFCCSLINNGRWPAYIGLPVASISFTVPGLPTAKARARAYVKKGTGRIGLFTPSKTKIYEGLVKRLATKAMAGLAPFEGPVQVDIKIYCAIAKSWPASKREAADNGLLWHTSKPDADNIYKTCDGMNGAVFLDDKQISKGSFEKLYSARPRVEVYIKELSQWLPKNKNNNGPRTTWSVGQLIPSSLMPETPARTLQNRLVNWLLQ